MRGDDIGVYVFLHEIRIRAKGRHMLVVTRRVSLLHLVERVEVALFNFELVSSALGWHDTGELNALQMNIRLSHTWHLAHCLWTFLEMCTTDIFMVCAWKNVFYKQAICPSCFHLSSPLLRSFKLWIMCPRALTLIWLCTYISRSFALNRMLHETQSSVQALLSTTPPMCHVYIF